MRSRSSATHAGRSLVAGLIFVLATTAVTTSVASLVGTTTASASELALESDKYDSKEAGHPLRIVAYVLHPVGVILDRLILRPAHWLGGLEPIKTLVGRDD